jgi:hypothetical protein
VTPNHPAKRKKFPRRLGQSLQFWTTRAGAKVSTAILLSTRAKRPKRIGAMARQSIVLGDFQDTLLPVPIPKMNAK